MDIKNKKTALDDSASIYSRNRDAANKENIKNLTAKQRLRYFMDYYSKKTAVVLLIIIGAAMLLNETVFNRSTCIFFVACVDDTTVADSEAMQADLEDYIGIENKNDYGSVTYYNRDDYNMNTAFITHMMTGSIDVIICSEDYFQSGSTQGMFADLSEILPEETYQSLSEKLVKGQTAETDISGEITSYGEPAAYGISIADSSKYSEFGGTGDPVLCVAAAATENTENILKVITYFTE